MSGSIFGGARGVTARLVAVLSCLALVAIAVVSVQLATPPADAVDPPYVQGALTNNWVIGRDFAPNVTVSVTVNGATPPNQPTTNSEGRFDYFSGSSGLDLVAGDVIVVDDGVNPAKTLTLVPMTLDTVVVTDPGTAAGTALVEGTAPVGPVRVGLKGCVTDISTDGTGAWSVTFQADGTTDDPGSCAGFVVEDDDSASAWVRDGDGDETWVHPTPPPLVQGALTNNWVIGKKFAPNVSVSVTVNGAMPPNQPSTDGAGEFRYFSGSHGLDLVVGDVIVVDDGVSPAKTLTLVPMTLDTFVTSDPGTAAGKALVEGTAPPGPLKVGLGGCIPEISTDVAGAWSVTFQADGTTDDPGSCPGFVVEANMSLSAWVRDDDTDETWVQPDPVFCADLRATINMNTNGGVGIGTTGDDVIVGTPAQDNINGLGGDDTICAGGGDDIVRGGPGDDTIFGEGGADMIRGGGGADMIDGGPDDDEILGQGGLDEIFGGRGDDKIDGLGAADTIDGGLGDDTINGQNGADTITGGNGDDTLKGQTGPDTFFGDVGNDQIFGGEGADTLHGGAGFDRCAGNTGPDKAEAATCELTPGVETLF